LTELERQGALERERGRIAQDIHDDLGSRLTRMALIAEMTGDHDAPGVGSELASAAREAIQAMDELVWTMNKRNDTVDGFVSYALAYAEEYLRAAKIQVRVHSALDQPAAALDAETRRHLFLTFKEALHNVVKHSGASEVHLLFETTMSENPGPEFSVQILDNGRGFEVSEADPTRSGLRGMSQRMISAGGRWEIRSHPGSGTGVHIHVSLGA
jgi:signal transduction histidine kinase